MNTTLDVLERRPLPVDEPALLDLDRAEAAWPGQRFGPFSLQVRGAERIAIVGPSGAGKSTLLKLMSGERPAAAGRVLLDGQPLARLGANALSRRRAVLPQAHGVAFGLPVALVVALGRIALANDPLGPGLVPQALARAHAEHLLERRFDTLSGGEMARVQLARVMAQLWDAAPGLLLVDEPLAALDPGLQLALLDALVDYCSERGHALVAIVHDLNQALGRFDRLWLVGDGGLKADLPADASAVPALERLFGIGLRQIDAGPGRVAVLPVRARVDERMARRSAA